MTLSIQKNIKLGIVLVVIIFWSNIASGQDSANTDQVLSFENISMKEGLSNLNVRCISQDEMGLIWIGTDWGLNRFDGNQFEQFFFSASDKTQLSDNSIWALHPWANGMIIETSKGLHYYDLQTEFMQQIGDFLNFFHLDNTCTWKGKFYNVKLDSTLSYFIEEEQVFRPVRDFPDSLAISNVYSDSIHGIWCTEELKNQLVLFHPGTGNVEFHDIYKNSPERNISDIQEIILINGLLWIGTKKGLVVYDPGKEAGLSNSASERLLLALKGKDIQFIEARKNEIWIGTLNHGLYIYYPGSQKYDHIANVEETGFFVCNLSDSYTDRDKNVWLATNDKGIFVQYQNHRKFNPNSNLNNLVKGRNITSIVADSSGMFYFASRHHGLIQFDTETSISTDYSEANSNLTNNDIEFLLLDSHGKLWLGQPDGLQIFDPRTKAFKNLELSEFYLGTVTIAEFKGLVYVGGGGVITVYDLKGQLLEQLTEIGQNIRQISPFNDESLLVCSHGVSHLGTGISVYTPESGIILKIEPSDPPEAWKEHYFITTFMDSEGTLWIGNFKWGLFRYNFENNSFDIFTKEDGLPNNYVIGITEDDAGNLWLSTFNGLSCFDKRETFRNYFYEDGIQNQIFEQKLIYKHDDGILYFGGNEGVTYFAPEEVLSVPIKAPNLILKALQINYETVLPGDGHQVLEQSLHYTSSVTLSHKQRSISIDYLGVNYGLAHKIEYAIVLEGFDGGWRDVGQANRAVYSNLPPGKYVFRVKARTSETDWSNPVSLQLRVKQTPWLSTWAIASYALMLIAVIVILFRLQLRTRLYQKDQEIEHSERMRDQEIHQMKIRFFTNISHELRTPLTVVSTMVYMLVRQFKPDGNSKPLFESLRLNVDRLLKLIDQIMTFRELENDALELQLRKLPLENILQEVRKEFLHFATIQKIHLVRDDIGSIGETSLLYDYDKVEKILANLLSNALKHTPQQGTVTISAREVSQRDALAKYEGLVQSGFPVSEMGYIEISVADTGSGIDEADLPTIFERYQTAEPGGKKLDYSGTGIGLNFIKRLISLHKGDIRVSSSVNQGSTFSFIIPLDKRVYSDENFLIDKPDRQNEILDGDLFTSEDLIEEGTDTAEEPYKIAVIEDNVELCDLMVKILSHKYQVVSANNGLAGYHLIEAEVPDLIVSDVMMPEMDGFTLCSKVKDHDLLNHIYFILLSAKSEVQDRIQGMERGADMYLSKPFHMDYLLAVVDAHFVRRKRFNRIFGRGKAPVINKGEENNAYREFVEKLNSILEKEIADEKFNVQSLASQMHMSRANFYRKFVSVLGITPNAYILKYRLNKATEFLEQSTYSIIEISEMVGFSNSGYFSTLFKKENGISPSKYLKSKG